MASCADNLERISRDPIRNCIHEEKEITRNEKATQGPIVSGARRVIASSAETQYR